MNNMKLFTHHILDVVLSNWDVAGVEYANLVATDKFVYRIDTGGTDAILNRFFNNV